MRDYHSAVFIGRFQPFHNEHLHVLQSALDLAEQVILLVGSYRTASSIKNPFSFGQREAMIRACLDREQNSRLQVHALRDYHYNDSLWVAEVQRIVHTLASNNPVCLVGAYKDASSYYLSMFPQWEFMPIKQKAFLDSTEIREEWYDIPKLMDYNHYHPHTAYDKLKEKCWLKMAYIPTAVFDWLDRNYFPTGQYHAHAQEFRHYEESRKQYGSGPFVTTDAVVTCAGHVLVVRRKHIPGRDLWALPGGFLKLSERIEDGAIRELKEETQIDVPKTQLKSSIVDSKVFDYPGRSLRGRTITHAFHVKLSQGSLPHVTGSDDADYARWMSISDIYANEDKFFEDHIHIIQHFITRI